MTEATLELVQAKQAELAALIDALTRKPQALQLPAAVIQLTGDEWYAGAVLNEDGTIKHHLVAVTHTTGLDFDEAQEWAKDRGLSAPTKQEARLIVAHRYNRLADLSWFWTCEPHSESSYAWFCHLYHGTVYYRHRSASGGAVAVRRVNP